MTEYETEMLALVRECRDILAGKAPPKVPSSPASASGGATLPNYGKAKGQPIHGASLDDLRYYAKGCERSLADDSKSRFHAKERATLAAIEAEIARQQGGAQPSEPPAGYGDDSEIPF